MMKTNLLFSVKDFQMSFKSILFKSNLSVLDVLVLMSIAVIASNLFGTWGILAAAPLGLVWGAISAVIERKMFKNA